MSTVHEFTTEELAEILVETWEAIPPSLAKVMTGLLQLLQLGEPVRPEKLAAATNLEARTAVKVARRFGAEFDEDGNIVGSGLTLVPTSHKYHVNGKDLFAWCAADTISFPALLNHSADIESPDPISGQIVRISVTPDGVEGLEPSSAVVTWSLKSDIDDIRGSFCNLVHFFASGETAAEYVSKHPGLVIVPVESVFEAANTLRETKAFKEMLAV